jgi:ketosteroid isomerase-like protein
VSFSLESYNPQAMIIEGVRAALMSDVGYRQRATGRVLRLRIAGFMRLQDGRLIEYREFIDKLRRGRTGAGARTAALTATLPRTVPDVRCTA